ncbi:HAD hydrolase-like protein, partial [Salmonella enterica]
HMLSQGLEATGGSSPETFRPLYKRMLAYYGEHLSVHTRPFPGVVAALDQLDAMGVTVAIVTNKFEDFALRLLDELGLRERFATI